MMSKKEELIEISNPEEITYTLTTSSNNQKVGIGYYIKKYLTKVTLDNEVVDVVYGSESVNVPNPGTHTIMLYLADTVTGPSNNYSLNFQRTYNSILFPYNFGSKYGLNGTIPLSANSNLQTNVEHLYFLDRVPFNANGLVYLKIRAQHIYIPKGSLQAYINNGYPADRLIEVKYKYTL